MSCILFVHPPRVSSSTKHTYMRYLINTFCEMGWQHSQLSFYDPALRSTGALPPTTQAAAMTRSYVATISASLPPPTTILLKLAWNTSSRWSDISQLTSSSVLRCAQEEVVLYFGLGTKASGQSPFRPDFFVVIQEGADRRDSRLPAALRDDCRQGISPLRHDHRGNLRCPSPLLGSAPTASSAAP
jgi:hypothetical protein